MQPNFMYRSHSKKAGFTLVELLAVVAIIAVLAGVVIAAMGNATSRAKLTAMQRQEQVLNSAYQTFVAGGGMPFDNSATVGEVLNSLLANDMLSYGVRGPFLTEVPQMTLPGEGEDIAELTFINPKFHYIVP